MTGTEDKSGDLISILEIKGTDFFEAQPEKICPPLITFTAENGYFPIDLFLMFLLPIPDFSRCNFRISNNGRGLYFIRIQSIFSLE